MSASTDAAASRPDPTRKSAEHLPPTGEQASHREGASRDHNALALNQARPEGAIGRFPGHGGQGGTSRASRDAALGNQHPSGPQLPGGQGGTSNASRDAALANQRHQGQRPEPRGAERQKTRTREANAQRSPGVSHREGPPQPQRVRPPGGGKHAPQQTSAKPAPKAPRKDNGGGQRGKKEEKHP